MNHFIPIEKGRHLGIDRNKRVCTLCKTNSIGDEFHYLFECDHFNEEIMKCCTKFYYNHPNSYKLNDLMNCKNNNTLVKLALICKTILSNFK